MKIGLVDLDTSHPASWVPILREQGQEIVAVYDGGTVHPPPYASEFAAKFGIPVVCQTVEEMVPLVDGAILHGCDWDRRLARAEPFLRAGRALLLDKPIAGNLRDLHALIEWEEKRGARITGGSALLHAAECAAFLARPVDERGMPQTVFAGCAVDEFNYGIHAYAMVCGLMGPGLQGVRHLRGAPQERIELVWPQGRSAYIAVGRLDNWLPCYATVVTNKTVTQIVVDSGNLYRSLLDAVLPDFTGRVTAPSPLRSRVEPELAALAVLKSRQQNGAFIPLADLTEDDPAYDGAAFALAYRRLVGR
jgi:hypothetical protein